MKRMGMGMLVGRFCRAWSGRRNGGAAVHRNIIEGANRDWHFELQSVMIPTRTRHLLCLAIAFAILTLFVISAISPSASQRSTGVATSLAAAAAPPYRYERKNPRTSGSGPCVRPVNLTNPAVDPEAFMCDPPVEWAFGLDPEKRALPSWSSITCNDQRHCLYENVCLHTLPNDQRAGFKYGQLRFFAEQAAKMTLRDLGYTAYRDPLREMHKSFSWHYPATILNNMPSGEVRYLPGTSLWWDQSYNRLNHPGHASETIWKLPELRRAFPGRVDRILYDQWKFAPGREVDSWLERGEIKKPKMLSHMCSTLKMAFAEEGFQLPPFYWWRHQGNTTVGTEICFEKILVPGVQRAWMTGPEEADEFRRLMLRFCEIPERPLHTPSSPPRVFFNERIADRKLANAEELCEHLNEEGKVEAFLDVPDGMPDICEVVDAAYSSDVIVGTDGSSNWLLPFVRPGAVLLLVYPYNFRVPDWKAMATDVGMRTVELVTLNRSLSLSNPPDKGAKINLATEKALAAPMNECFHMRCRLRVAGRWVIVPQETFDQYLKYALETLLDNTQYRDCEKNLVWPLVNFPRAPKMERYVLSTWQSYGWALNYAICEPPAPNCLCCNNEECLNATDRLVRSF